MGAGTVINFANQYPERVAGLVIADSLHGIVETDEVAAIMAQARDDTANLSQLDRVLGKAFKEENPAAAVLYQQINSFNAIDKSNLTGVYASEKVTAAQLASLGMPIMFISAQDDILFPIAAVRIVQEQVTGSFMVEFDNCGHSAFFERAEEFNDSILSFLQMAGLNPLHNSAHSNASGYEKAM